MRAGVGSSHYSIVLFSCYALIYIINRDDTQTQSRTAANTFRVLKLQIYVYILFNSIDGSGE